MSWQCDAVIDGYSLRPVDGPEPGYCVERFDPHVDRWRWFALRPIGSEACEFCGVQLSNMNRYQLAPSSTGKARLLFACYACFWFWSPDE